MKVKASLTDPLSSGAEPRYGAPALEKGLELLEALAAEPVGMGQKALADRVGRSVTEIYRMLNVLERQHYIVRDASSGQYTLTLKLFELANIHPPTRRLLHTATPVMRQLSEQTGQSCHLVVLHGDRILVVADEHSSLPMAFTVRLGATFPISSRYASARVLAAFQPKARRIELARRMIESQRQTTNELPALLARLAGIASNGHDEAPGEFIHGVIDISYPVRDHLGTAVAALTIPYLDLVSRDEAMGQRSVAAALEQAAQRISQAIGSSEG